MFRRVRDNSKLFGCTPMITQALVLLVVFVALLAGTNAGLAEQKSCLDAIMSPSSDSTLSTMLLNTGKYINDLGQMDACEADQTTKYVLLNIKTAPIYLGLCLPKECGHDDMKIVIDSIELLSKEMQLGLPQAQAIIPSEDLHKMNTGTILAIIFFSGLFCLIVLGMITEYTDLFGVAKPDNYEELNDAQKDKELLKSKSKLGTFFLCFSFSRNLRKTFWTPQRDDDHLSVLNGIRVISMGYVILGHTYEITAAMPLTNTYSLGNSISEFYTVIVTGGFFSVDVFFFMSSFLGAYLMIQKFYGKGPMNFGLIYFHRFYRLVPTIALFTFLVVGFMDFTGDGPYWGILNQVILEPCRQYWWTNLLFINNFYPDSNIRCIGPLWYLANDMQFFIVLPIVVFAYIKKRAVGYALTLFLMNASIVISFVITHVGHHSFSPINDVNGIQIYSKPYTRIHAYMVGALFGMLYFEYTRSKSHPEVDEFIGARFYNFIQNSKPLRWILYLLGSLIMVGLICLPHADLKDYPGHNFNQVSYDFINAFQRPLFVTGMAFFIAGPITGKGSLIRFVLGGSAWAPWAKVTFLVYLSHIFVLTFFLLQRYNGLFFTHRALTYIFIGSFILSYLIAVPLSMCLEAPFLQLERLLLFPPKKMIVFERPAEKNYFIEKDNKRINDSSVGSDSLSFAKSVASKHS